MHAADRWHLAEAIREVVELLDAVGQPYGELLGEELRGAEESTCDTTCEPKESRAVSSAQYKIQMSRTGQFSRVGNSPTEGFSPNWTIWRRETPVAGKLAK